jgi:N-acetylglucosamine kinase-like BadF-type ATPase
MALALGIDAGGTKTLARVVQGDKVLFEGQGGPANLATNLELVEESLREALKGCPKVEAACGCFAGLLTSGDKTRAEDLLRALLNTDRVQARPDFHAAWEVAKDRCDVLVIAGTGVLVCSEKDGAIVKSGGGGVLFGDEGSAASVGRLALQGQLVSALTLPATDAFWNKVEKNFGSRERDEVLAALYKSKAPGALFASLCETVAQDAASEKDYAVFAVSNAIVALRDEVVAHVLAYKKEKLPKIRIGLTGGLWKSHPIFFQWFKPFEDEPRVTATKNVLEIEPVAGACMIAEKML